MKIIITIYIMLLFGVSLHAQEEIKATYRIKSKTISLKLIGAPTAPLGVSFNQKINDRLSLEFGVGVFSLGTGLEYSLSNPRKRRFNLNTGLFGSVTFDGSTMVYVPFGFSYLGKKDFQYSANIGVLYAEDVYSVFPNSQFNPWFGISIGKRFGEEVLQKNRDGNGAMPENVIEKTDLRNVLSGKIGGWSSPLIAINFERLIGPYFGLEYAIGLVGISAGANVYFPAITPSKISLKTGVRVGSGLSGLEFENYVYVPMGLNYMTKDNVIIGFDIVRDYGDNEMGASLKIGKAF
ncbi:MAG: hypothetical protein QNK63_03985 [Flavobacteriales bacterium]|jgi:hypothetical protein